MDIERARSAQKELRDLLSQCGAKLGGIGLAKKGEDFVVKVNVIDDAGAAIPTSLHGVAIEVERVNPPALRLPRR